MIRGWCPTVHAPMPSGDGLLVRIKPFGGRLSAAALRAVAAAVEAYGNGVVELTGRGNLQVRGVWNAPAFAAAMVAAGLADADPVREARRNVVIVPPCDDALVAEAEAMMADTPGQAAKYYLVVDCTGIRSASPGPLTQPSPAGGRGLSLLQGEGGHLLHLPFGQTNAATLARLAALVPELRTTPWRAFLSATPVPGFDRPSTIIACVGAPGCASATVPARADAALLDAMGLTDLHVSGCAKGCAHPGPARTLVGRDGRYDLVRHGRASDKPDATGLTLEQAAAL
jgi:precorrin-3B synthase